MILVSKIFLPPHKSAVNTVGFHVLFSVIYASVRIYSNFEIKHIKKVFSLF